MTERPLPRLPEPDSQPFWMGTAEREMRFRVCRRCGSVVFFIRRHCPTCGADDLEDRVSSGLGTVYSFTVVHRDGQPQFRGRTPYVHALVDLDEGFRILSEIVTDDVGRVAIGQRVHVTWEEHDEVNIPLFTTIE